MANKNFCDVFLGIFQIAIKKYDESDVITRTDNESC